MKLSDAFPSRYVKAGDLRGRTPRLTIRRVTQETIGDDVRLVVAFTETSKLLPLNRTNAQRIARLVGDDDTDRWPGHAITLTVEPVEFKGQLVDAVRVVLGPSSPPEAAAARPVNDPFARLGSSEF